MSTYGFAVQAEYRVIKIKERWILVSCQRAENAVEHEGDHGTICS